MFGYGILADIGGSNMSYEKPNSGLRPYGLYNRCQKVYNNFAYYTSRRATGVATVR